MMTGVNAGIPVPIAEQHAAWPIAALSVYCNMTEFLHEYIDVIGDPRGIYAG